MNKPIILVIDDDPTLGRALSERLIEEGYDVRTAQNGHEGLTLALELQPSLTFLDYKMPDIDGLRSEEHTSELQSH